MEDYYRVRFSRLLGARRPTSRVSLGDPAPPDMPIVLRAVYTVSCALAAAGWVAAVLLGRAPLGTDPLGLGVLVLVLPAAVALALGFSEQQAWTRPLLILLLLLSAGAALAFRTPWTAALLGALTLVTAAYLYASPSVRTYYRRLHGAALVRVARADLQSAAFVPLYTSAAGIALGLWLGYAIVTRSLGAVDGMGANDVTGLVAVAVFCAALLGVVGCWIGEAVVARRARHTEAGRV